MNIIYGVAGEGRGHLSRSKEIINYLKIKKHKILIITHGQAYASLSKNFPTIRINGIHPIFKKNKMELISSIYNNTFRVIKDLIKWKEINKKIREFSPDLFITDFEPFTARLAYYHNKPLISIDNQHLLLQEIPSEFKKNNYKNFLISKYASRFCVPKADLFIILSLNKANIKTKKTIITPTIIRSEIKKAKKHNHVLVYLSKPDYDIIKVLEELPENFVVYGYNKDHFYSNINLKKDNQDFIKNLASCKAVIATAGFSLISEAVFLKKPYFALPYYHFEQTLNAHFIKKQGFGEFSEKPSKKEIMRFLENLPSYERNLNKTEINGKYSLELINKAVNELGIKNL
jgi:uncharacterized protein (TIGR00661 family)